MEGVINNFRRGRSNQKTNHIIISFPGITTKEKAAEQVGKKVYWKTQKGRLLAGEIKAAHGNSGCVRAIFQTGLPGQSLGTKVEVK